VPPQPLLPRPVRRDEGGKRFAVIDSGDQVLVLDQAPTYAIQPRFPPTKTFPTFLPYAQKMLAALRLGP